MPEVDTYSFKYREVIEALIKQADLHDGRWQLVMTFGLGAVNMGPSAPEIVPGAAIAVTGLGLQRAKPESPEALVLDASIVNPASTASQPPV